MGRLSALGTGRSSVRSTPASIQVSISSVSKRQNDSSWTQASASGSCRNATLSSSTSQPAEPKMRFYTGVQMRICAASARWKGESTASMRATSAAVIQVARVTSAVTRRVGMPARSTTSAACGSEQRL